MAKYKVVVINPGYESYHLERKILEPVGAEVIVAQKDCDAEDLIIALLQRPTWAFRPLQTVPFGRVS